MSYDLKTQGGYPLDEAASALQKSIRRGLIKDAMYWAYEINTNFPDYLWRRLVVIACEDIGPANPELVGTIASLAERVERIRKASKTKEYDLAILGFAILQMADSPKSREADDLVNEVLRERRTGKMVLSVPDYALDMHTERGRQRGKTVVDFWGEGAKLENEFRPSRFVGWDPAEGDGYKDASGKRVEQPRDINPDVQRSLF